MLLVKQTYKQEKRGKEKCGWKEKSFMNKLYICQTCYFSFQTSEITRMILDRTLLEL